MELIDIFKGLGMIMICIVGVGSFYFYGVNKYELTETENIFGYNSTEYVELVGNDLNIVQNGTITTGTDYEILTGIGSIIKGFVLMPKWLGLITDFSGNALNSLPIPADIAVLVLTMITAIIVGAIIFAFWRSRV